MEFASRLRAHLAQAPTDPDLPILDWQVESEPSRSGDRVAYVLGILPADRTGWTLRSLSVLRRVVDRAVREAGGPGVVAHLAIAAGPGDRTLDAIAQGAQRLLQHEIGQIDRVAAAAQAHPVFAATAASLRGRLAELLRDRGLLGQAVDTFSQAIAALDGASADDPLVLVASVHAHLGRSRVLHEAGRDEEAREAEDLCLTRVRMLNEPRFAPLRADVLSQLARLRVQAQDDDTAEPLLREALSARKASRPAPGPTADLLRLLVVVSRRQGRTANALAAAGEMAAVLRQSGPEHRRELGVALAFCAQLLVDASRTDEAIKLAQEAVFVLDAAVSDGEDGALADLLRARGRLGEAFEAQGEILDAVDTYQTAARQAHAREDLSPDAAKVAVVVVGQYLVACKKAGRQAAPELAAWAVNDLLNTGS